MHSDDIGVRCNPLGIQAVTASTAAGWFGVSPMIVAAIALDRSQVPLDLPIRKCLVSVVRTSAGVWRQ
jgi:hypothetical protein